MDENVLSEEEKCWCTQIRVAAEKEKVSYDSDFSLAQFAIVTKGSVPKALKRMRKQNEYKALRKHSVEEAAENIAKMILKNIKSKEESEERKVIISIPCKVYIHAN